MVGTSIRDSAQKHLTEQRDYVIKRHLENQREAILKSGGGSGLVDERMLAESMRSVRYLDEAHAAGDIIDNAIEAGATQVHVVYNTKGSTITDIAFVDDGSGIEPVFLPHATKWGGSSNDGRRNVFGRFGFGLPSASVNRGRSYSVYSRTAADAAFGKVSVDLDNLGSVDGVVPLPSVSEEPLPGWVREYVERAADAGGVFRGGLDAVRTAVVWSGLDRLQWPNRQQSAGRFREHLGITYFGWLDVAAVYVDGEGVEPLDVLFTTPGARYYDIDDAPMAEPKDPIRFEVPDRDGVPHTVTVRYSLLTVGAMDARVRGGGKGQPPKVRQRIRKAYNGIFVTRNGRFIELARPEFINWNIYARQVGVALDFPPELDELFGVTPDKQTIMFGDKLQQLLSAKGVDRAHRALVKVVEDERRSLKEQRDRDAETGKRPSEETIAKVVELDPRKTRKPSPEAKDEAERNFKRKVKEVAAETGLDEKVVEEARRQQLMTKPYRVEFTKQTEDDPFYTPYMDEVQLVLRINTAHPWYREVYGQLREDQSELRSGLELMLFVLATSEVDSTGDTRVFYRTERLHWSRTMAHAFDIHALVYNEKPNRLELEEERNTGWVEDATEDESEGGAETETGD